MAFDLVDSKIDLDHIITVMENIIITGDKGTDFSFLRLRQYAMCCKTANVQVECDKCLGVDVQQQDYYKVCIKGEKFLIPTYQACIEGNLRKSNEQNLRENWNRLYVDQTKDYEQACREVLGIEVNTGKKDIANREYADRISREKGRNNGRQYGSTDPTDTNFSEPFPDVCEEER